ncbi:MAG: phosphatase PAP2 family protein [Bacteroidota bacterium]
MRRIVYLLFFILNVNLALSAGDSASYFQNMGAKVNSDFKATVEDGIFIWNEISTLENQSLYEICGVAGLTGLGIIADKAIREGFARSHSKFNDDYFQTTNYLGDGFNAVAFSGVLYLGGLFSGWDDLRITGRQSFEALALAGIVTTGIKVITGRARPFMERDNLYFKPFNLKDEYLAFPSGHTTVAFAVATVLACKIDTWWSYPLFYSAALSTGLARIYLDKHWISDVILGAAVGTLSSLVILKSESNRNSKNASSHTILIYPANSGIGIAYIY